MHGEASVTQSYSQSLAPKSGEFMTLRNSYSSIFDMRKSSVGHDMP